VQIARSAYWRVLISETLESFRVKNAVVIVHITEKLSGEYACLTASSNLQYAPVLARGAHESAQDGSHGVLLA